MGQDRPRHDQLQTVAISQQAGNCSNSHPFHESVAHVVACDACRTAAVSARGRYAADHYFIPSTNSATCRRTTSGRWSRSWWPAALASTRRRLCPRTDESAMSRRRAGAAARLGRDAGDRQAADHFRKRAVSSVERIATTARPLAERPLLADKRLQAVAQR